MREVCVFTRFGLKVFSNEVTFEQGPEQNHGQALAVDRNVTITSLRKAGQQGGLCAWSELSTWTFMGGTSGR